MKSFAMISKPVKSDFQATGSSAPQRLLHDVNALFKQLAQVSLLQRDSTDLFNQMLAIALDASGFDYAAITRTDARNERAEMLSFVDRDGAKEVENYDVLGTPCQAVLAANDVVIFQDVQFQFADETQLVSLNITEYVGMKFYVAGRSAGHVFLMSTTASDATSLEFTQVVLRVLAMYAAAHCDCIQNKQQMESLSAEAYSDAMTGLRNKRAFDHDIERVMQQLQSNQLTDALLILLDIDGLKAVNDTRGHATGDELIRFIAIALKSEARQQDLIYRLGGDEFAILITGNARDALMGVSHRLETWRQRIAVSSFAQSGISLGSALLSETHNDIAANLKINWFKLADSRLYQDKAGKHARLPVTCS